MGDFYQWIAAHPQERLEYKALQKQVARLEKDIAELEEKIAIVERGEVLPNDYYFGTRASLSWISAMMPRINEAVMDYAAASYWDSPEGLALEWELASLSGMSKKEWKRERKKAAARRAEEDKIRNERQAEERRIRAEQELREKMQEWLKRYRDGGDADFYDYSRPGLQARLAKVRKELTEFASVVVPLSMADADLSYESGQEVLKQMLDSLWVSQEYDLNDTTTNFITSLSLMRFRITQWYMRNGATCTVSHEAISQASTTRKDIDIWGATLDALVGYINEHWEALLRFFREPLERELKKEDGDE